MSDTKAPAPTRDEQIAAKVRAGLDKAQAEQVLKDQEAHDAAQAEAEKAAATKKK